MVFVVFVLGLILLGLLILSYRLAAKKWSGMSHVFMTWIIFFGFCLGLVGVLVGGCFLVLSSY